MGLRATVTRGLAVLTFAAAASKLRWLAIRGRVAMTANAASAMASAATIMITRWLRQGRPAATSAESESWLGDCGVAGGISSRFDVPDGGEL